MPQLNVLSRPAVVATLAVGSGIGIAGIATAESSRTSGQIIACVSKGNTAGWRQVGPRAVCRSGERRLV